MYYVDEQNKFVVENYNWKTSFSNFLPGISGIYGIPMWVYYVSRNQGIVSLGVRSKNHPILEFQSFNKALNAVGSTGYRTFIKTNGVSYEPFRKTTSNKIKQKLIVSSAELEINEINFNLDIEFNVLYFPIVNTNFPAFARILTIKNISKKNIALEYIDGLPRILPFGVDLHGVNTIARHIEGMMETVLYKGAPIYRLKQTPADIEKVGKIEGGNFYLSIAKGKNSVFHQNYIYDPAVVFDDSEIYERPWNFFFAKQNKFDFSEQISTNKTPSALTYNSINLKAGESHNLYSLVGYAQTDALYIAITNSISSIDFFTTKRDENINIIEAIKKISFAGTADKKLNQFIEQTFLDNVIRGGMPIVFSTANKKSAFYVYSRQNGDLERDYHFFIIEPTYYSQGTGHYRSVNQNRRCDTWFFPEIEDRNIVTFMSLIQFDGYNPLEFTQLTYSLAKPEKLDAVLAKFKLNKKNYTEIADYLKAGKFTPGELIMKLEAAGSKINYTDALKSILAISIENECGNIHEGYWIDHWLYNLDLIENYLMIYPENYKKLFLDNRDYYYYDNPDIVRNLEERFTLIDSKVYQYNSVYRDKEKIAMINSRKQNPMMARTNYGKGKIYRSNLTVKLLCLIANRMATFDAHCIGIEMEADKPGWNDSMNGLPGILGSSLCQTFELERAVNMLLDVCDKLKEFSTDIYIELFNFLKGLDKLIIKYNESKSKNKNYEYWLASHKLKDKYRNATKFGISGIEKKISFTELKKIANNFKQFISNIYSPPNKSKVFDKNGIPYTYIINKVIKYRFCKDKKGNILKHISGYPLVIPEAFKQEPLPLFLEGPVHYFKVHPEKASTVYKALRNSPIFDKKLKMYKVCESLENAPFEIGRVKAWGAGWIENESVYTHMEYKYILEIIKSGLYNEFYKDIKTMLTPYIPTEMYARSPFENVSFIVSSVFADKKMHGRGLQPRLSGVTSEMINIWIIMVAGTQPFYVDSENQLIFRPQPILTADLFNTNPSEFVLTDNDKKISLKLQANSLAFKLFGNTILIYYNPKHKNTFGEGKVTPAQFNLYYKNSNKNFTVIGSELKGKYANDLRSGKISKLEIELR